MKSQQKLNQKSGQKLRRLWLTATATTLAFVLVFSASTFVATPSVSAEQYHTVQSGEYLATIASRYDTTVADIVRLNNLGNPNLIYPGQLLIIPSAITKVSTGITEGTYYVQPGDTLTHIARKLKTTVSFLVAQNNIPNPNYLRVGQPIKYGLTNVSSAGSFLYRVRSGDTISTIAVEFETSVSDILELNEIDDPNEVYVGDLVRVPAPALLAVMDYWANTYGVPPDLLKALTWWESGWDNTRISSANAIGIGQLIPSTVEFVSEVLIGEQLNPHIPEENIRMSARFMSYLLTQTNGDTNYALAAYYQGLGAVQRHGVYNQSWPYVNGIQALRPQFR